MRRQWSLLPAAALTLVLTMTGAACRSEAPPAATADRPEATPASEDTIPPREETPSSDAGTPASAPATVDDAAQPGATGLSPRQQTPARPTTPSRPPAAATSGGVTPSPTIGGSADTAARDAAEAPAPAEPRAQRLIALPSGTALPLELTTAIASDTAAVEDRVTARVTRDVEIDDEVVVPAGSTVAGRVTYAQPSGRVKGRAGVTARFYTLTIGERSYDIEAEPLRREAEGTKGKDAQKIGIGAGAGAVVGGLLGGRKGAAIGAAAGGAGGAGVVLATRGEEVRLPAGTAITLRLTAPVTLSPR